MHYMAVAANNPKELRSLSTQSFWMWVGLSILPHAPYLINSGYYGLICAGLSTVVMLQRSVKLA
eukprot:1157475-Pelagomonas_calceolata.AAC.4